MLENNVAHKRPIEGIVHYAIVAKLLQSLNSFVVLVGKKNLEVRPIAINKGEIVKRIIYMNPDAQFVFCAGDDKVRLSQLSCWSRLTFSALQ